MSTGINIASSSGLTVGTTTVTSGTDGRVFFQAGGVLQQSANLFWDNSNNRLGVGTSSPGQTLDVSGNSRFQFGTIESGINITGNSGSTTAAILIGTGTLGTSGSLEIWRNGAFALQFVSNIANLGTTYTRLKQGAGLTITGSGGSSTAANSLILGSNATDAGVFTATSGTQNTINIGTSTNDVWSPSSGTATYNLLRINPRTNTSGSYSGIVRGILIDPTLTSTTGVTYRAIETTTGDVVFASTSGNVAIGSSSPGARLDVRAQGALSTDIAFRVRNSANTGNLANITGLGDVYLGGGVTVTNQGSEPMIAIGKAITVNGIFNSSPIAIGHTTTSIGNSIAIGRGSSAGDSGINNSIAIGFNAVATGGSASGSPAIAFGTNVTASSQNPGSIITGHSLGMGGATSANIVYGRYMNGASFLGNAFAFGSGVSDASRASLDLGDSFSIYINQNTRALFLNQKSNLVFRNGQSLTSVTHFDANATNTFTIHNGTIPTTDIANAGQIYVESGTLRFRDSAGTITNVGGSVQSVASAATVTPVYTNKYVKITAQAVALTLANPTGTWAEGQELIIRIKDSGSAQTIAYDTNYRAIGVTLPTTTTASKTTYLGIIYNSDDAKWDVIGVTTQA